MEMECDEIINIIAGHRYSMILFTCLDLGVFEILHKEKSQNVENLSQKLHSHKESTERLLNAATMLKLLFKDKDCQGIDVYRNSSSTEKYLLISSRPCLRNDALLSYRFGYQLFFRLPEAVKTGCRQVSQTHHLKADQMFQHKEGIYSNDDLQYQFLAGMDDHAAFMAPEVVRAFNLSCFNTACDLGGASGAFGYELIRAYPHMKVIVADLSNVIEMAHCFKANDGNDYSNLSFQAVDFFVDPLPPADLYIMTWVLHDWNESKINELLAIVYSSLKTGGGLLIGEKILHDDKVGPCYPQTIDLAMLVATLGKERSFSEYKILLEKQGFCNIQLNVTKSISDAILCFKK